MNKHVFYLVILLLPLFSLGQVSTDAKLWTGISLEKEIHDLEIQLNQEFRFNENVTHLEKTLTELQFEYKMDKPFYLRWGYRFDQEFDYETKNVDVNHRVELGLAIKKKFLYDWKFKYRTKFQMKFKSTEKEDPFYWRNKFTMEYRRFDIEPYVSYEFYFKFNNKFDFNRNRYFVGAKYDLNKDSSLKVFYFYEDKFNRKNLKVNHVWGVMYRYEL